ncbi:MAG: DUF4845 domain-containing protein [Burkholderiales bacterium]
MNRQRGVTFIGMVFIAMVVIFAAIVVIRIVPAYIEYATIVKHLKAVAEAPEARAGTPRDIQMAFDRRAQVDDIRSISGMDIDVIREGESVSLTAAYSRKVKLMGNVSACIDFVAKSD